MGCRTISLIDNGLGIDNQEQGQGYLGEPRPPSIMDRNLAKG